MDLRDIPAPYDSFIADLLRRRGRAPADFPGELPSGDDMFRRSVLPGYGGDLGRAAFRYFESAFRTADIHRQLADHLGGYARVERLLDFGSGWGRLTRCLLSDVPAAKIYVSDINRDAIAWQAATYGVTAVASAADPDDFELAERFDLILSASVFSHLPDSLFGRWIARLSRLVSPGGLLAFSVHSDELLPAAERGGDQLTYRRWSESSTLDADIYGMAYTSEAYVADALARHGTGLRPGYRRFPRALFENQDLYVVGGPDADLDGLELAVTPVGGVRPLEAATSGGGLIIEGWGIDFNPGHQISGVRLTIEGRRLADAIVTADNVAALAHFPEPVNMPVRWRLSVADHLVRDRLLTFELQSSTGLVAPSYGYIAQGQPTGPFPRT